MLSNLRVCIFFLLVPLSVIGSEREKQIRKFVETEFLYYPEARLTDLYKNYFQDAYGPKHLIADTAKAAAYINWELKQTDWIYNPDIQALGVNHDYYRVNLLLVKNGVIPRDTLLLAMVKSASLARSPGIEEWKDEWAEVVRVIKIMKPDLPKLKSDERRIAKMLAKGEVVAHHSKYYEKTYHPHYRIIHRSIVNTWLGKYF